MFLQDNQNQAFILTDFLFYAEKIVIFANFLNSHS